MGMAESNGNEAHAALERLKSRVDEQEKSTAALRTIVRNLEDAMVVQTSLEQRQNAAILKNEARQVSLEARAEEEEKRQRQLDERVDKLVSSIGELIRRIPPENLRGKKK
jgi:hypothetical protein